VGVGQTGDPVGRGREQDPVAAVVTAHGVLQAVNTHEHHEGTVGGASRADGNILRTVTGDFGQLDRATWKELETILAEPPSRAGPGVRGTYPRRPHDWLRSLGAARDLRHWSGRPPARSLV
jgi:hypothetical protein